MTARLVATHFAYNYIFRQRQKTMPAQQPNEDLAAPQENGGETQPKKSLLRLNLLIILVMFVVALTEMLMAYLFILPSPETVKATVDDAARETVKVATPYQPVVTEALQVEEREEVDLGEFTFTEGDPTSAPFRLSIHFYGLINKKDKEEYNKRYELNKNRIRNAILVILRSSQQSEITDPSLGLIKNKIMVKVNEILGMPLVKGIIYTDIAVQTGG